MGTIPIYRQQTRVSGSPTGVGNVNEGAGLVAIGNAIQSASQDVVAGRAITARKREEEARIAEQKLEEQAQVAANTELMSARSEWLTTLQKRKAEAPVGATNFTGSLLEEFDADMGARIERGQTQRAKQYIRQRLGEVRLGLQQDAMTFEAGSIVDHKTGQLVQSVDAGRTAVEFRPQDFDAVAAEQAKAIIASGLPAETQAKMTEDAFDALSASAVAGMIRANPYRALVELNNERSENTAVRALSFDARQRLRAAAESEIRSREVESRDARNRLLTDLKVRVEDSEAAYLHGMDVEDPPTRADFEAAYGDERAPAKGLIEAGNIDLHARPVVKNADGSISTVLSMSREQDGQEVLVPMIVDGKKVSEAAAWDHYLKTGEHLGKFDTPEHATAYAKALHEDQAAEYGGGRRSEGDRRYEAFAAIQRIGADLKVAARLPPDEQAALLAAREPTQVEGAADQIKAHDILASHIANLNKQLEADPAAYVAAYDPATSAAAAAMGEEMTPATVDAYATASLSAQAVHGVTSPKLLTDGQAQQMGERLKLTGNGADVVAAINAERDLWGRHWQRALTEASPKLNPVVQVMALETPITGTAAGPHLSMDPVPAARLATVASMSPADLAKLMPDGVRLTGQDSIESEVQANLADFGQTLIGAAGAEAQLVQISDAATKLAASYVAGGASTAKAAKRATDEVLLSRYHVGEFGGSLLRFPIGVDNDLVLAGLRAQDDAFLEALDTDYDEVAWRTLPDDTGVVLEDRATGRPVATDDGKPYMLSFAQLMQLGVNRREAARRGAEDIAAGGGFAL